MLAFIGSVAIFLTEGHEPATGGFSNFYNEYLNIPGFEAWKFINLAIFLVLLFYVTRKTLSTAFKEKRDAIRAELIRAEEEKKAALDRLTSIEARLAQLETEKKDILANAAAEAMSEKERIAAQTASDVERLHAQSESELDRLAKQSRAMLRRYSAEESIRLAEAKLRADIDDASDARLVKAGIAEIGGLN